jgi:hypothetical protein
VSSPQVGAATGTAPPPVGTAREAAMTVKREALLPKSLENSLLMFFIPPLSSSLFLYSCSLLPHQALPPFFFFPASAGAAGFVRRECTA